MYKLFHSVIDQIISPIVFNIYTADLTDWVKYSKLFNYADDTTSCMEGRNLELIIKKLEEDADLILSFMASNGLVANPKKTTKNIRQRRYEKNIYENDTYTMLLSD